MICTKETCENKNAPAEYGERSPHIPSINDVLIHLSQIAAANIEGIIYNAGKHGDSKSSIGDIVDEFETCTSYVNPIINYEGIDRRVFFNNLVCMTDAIVLHPDENEYILDPMKFYSRAFLKVIYVDKKNTPHLITVPCKIEFALDVYERAGTIHDYYMEAIDFPGEPVCGELSEAREILDEWFWSRINDEVSISPEDASLLIGSRFLSPLVGIEMMINQHDDVDDAKDEVYRLLMDDWEMRLILDMSASDIKTLEKNIKFTGDVNEYPILIDILYANLLYGFLKMRLECIIGNNDPYVTSEKYGYSVSRALEESSDRYYGFNVFTKEVRDFGRSLVRPD